MARSRTLWYPPISAGQLLSPSERRFARTARRVAAVNLIGSLPRPLAVGLYNRALRHRPYKTDAERFGLTFVHIPKTAGISLLQALGISQEVNHFSIIDYFLSDPEFYENSLKAAFVRDPLDRFVSAYSFLKAGGRSRMDADFSKWAVEKTDSLATFVQCLERDRRFYARVMSYIHFIPQYAFVAPYGTVEADFLGRFERLDADAQRLMAACKVSGPQSLPRLNTTPTRHGPEYDDPAVVDFVRRTYFRDYQIFGYDEPRVSARKTGARRKL